MASIFIAQAGRLSTAALRATARTTGRSRHIPLRFTGFSRNASNVPASEGAAAAASSQGLSAATVNGTNGLLQRNNDRNDVSVNNSVESLPEIEPLQVIPAPGLKDDNSSTANAPADPSLNAGQVDLSTAALSDASSATTAIGADSTAVAVDATSATGDATAAAATAASQVSEAATTSMGFSDMLLQPTMQVLHAVHDFTGLPWWLAIALSTVAVRTLLLPLSIKTMKNSAVLGSLQGDIALRREAVLEAVRSGNKSLAEAKQRDMQKFMRDAGVSPFKALMGPLLQFPIFISFFVGVRRLAVNDPSMATGGAAWFSDLSVADPYYVLPIISGLSLSAMTELGGDTGTKMTPVMKKVLRGVAVISVPLTYWFPAGVFCYWLPNNFYSIGLALALKIPAAKKAAGLVLDPATIPGTRAFQEKASKAGVPGGRIVERQKFDPAMAAASYVKTSENLYSPADTVRSSIDEQPVLLKNRPRKRAKGRAL